MQTKCLRVTCLLTKIERIKVKVYYVICISKRNSFIYRKKISENIIGNLILDEKKNASTIQFYAC